MKIKNCIAAMLLACACVPLVGCGETNMNSDTDSENSGTTQTVNEETIKKVTPAEFVYEEIEFAKQDSIVFGTGKSKRSEVDLKNFCWLGGGDESDFYKKGYKKDKLIDNFIDFYNKEINEKSDCEFYFIEPKGKEVEIFGWLRSTIYVCAEAELDEANQKSPRISEDGKYAYPIVTQSIYLEEEKFYPDYANLTDEELKKVGVTVCEDGSRLYGDACANVGSLNLFMTYYPVKADTAKEEFHLEFFKEEVPEREVYFEYFDEYAIAPAYTDYFVDIYRGDVCIATCEYDLIFGEFAKEPITYSWFEDYFKSTLRLVR